MVSPAVTWAPDSVVLDVGANIGIYTLLAAKRGARVIAIEADPRNVEKLRHHVHLNGFDDRVTILPIAVGDKVVAEIDHAGRTATRRNHSATHLLHYALRKVLGEHAHQKGSLVGPERLRFDFMQGKAVELEELQRIEDLVNEKVLIAKRAPMLWSAVTLLRVYVSTAPTEMPSTSTSSTRYPGAAAMAKVWLLP